MASPPSRSRLDSWPCYLFLTVAFALWGVSKLTRGSDGTDTFFDVLFLFLAVGNGARAVVAFRNRPTG